MKKKVFAVRDLVFAKVRGYPAWPARVTGLAGSGKYSVFFYGTYEVGNIKPENMWPYNEKNLDKFGPSNMRKKWYSEGLYQIKHTPDIAFEQGSSNDWGGVSVQVDMVDQYTSEKNAETAIAIGFPTNISNEIKVGDTTEDKKQPINTNIELDNETGEKASKDTGGIEDGKRDCNDNTENIKKVKEEIILQKVKKLKWLKSEQKLVDIVCRIQKCMSKNKPYNISKCVNLLKLMEKIDIKPLMVIKMPEVFTTLKRLSTECISNSDDKSAAEVKEISDRLKQKIVSSFIVNPGTGSLMSSVEFENILAVKVEEFKNKTYELSDRERLGIINLEDVK